MKISLKHIVITLLAAVLGSDAFAKMEATTFPQETRLVQFVYDENRTFDILTRPNAITDIRLSAGETLVAFALGDTVQWIIDQSPGHIFVKPTREDLFTSATMVTDKRSYQLQLRAMPTDGNWYQRVSWDYPSLVIARNKAKKTAENETKRLESITAGVVATPEALNFNYEISGKASFTPETAFDDGRFTWLRIPKSSQETPAIFMADTSGKLSLVNYTIRGGYIVVQRLADTLILKTGSAKAVVRNKAKTKKSNKISIFGTKVNW